MSKSSPARPKLCSARLTTTLTISAEPSKPSLVPVRSVVDDDLQHHSVGCYTAVSEIKKDNRTTETALMTGEKMAALANVLAGFPYPKSDFDASWKKVLLMQFHDSMAGTALPEHYAVSHNAYGFAREVADQAIYRSAEKIAWQIPSADPASEYVVVFNPHAWAANLNVQYDLDWGLESTAATLSNSRLEDEHGNAIPHQWTAGQTVAGDRRGLVFQAPVPAFGYRQFRLRKVEPVAAQRRLQIGASRTVSRPTTNSVSGYSGNGRARDPDVLGQAGDGFDHLGAKAMVICAACPGRGRGGVSASPKHHPP